MSWHIAYVTSESGPPIDGPHIASTRGYADFGTYVEQRARQFPVAASLVERGFVEVVQGGEFEMLELDLRGIATAARESLPDVAGVADHLLTGLRECPAETRAVLVTDGEPNEELEGDNY